MRIQYVSDLHLEHSQNSEYLRRHPLEVTGDVLVVAGDSGYIGEASFSSHPFWDWASDHYEEVIVALGNHEFYNYVDLATLANGTIGEIRHNVHYHYNNMVQINDVYFIVSTLWSHIDSNHTKAIQCGVTDFGRIMYDGRLLTPADFNQEHERCLQFVKEAVEKTRCCKQVVVTHHVPSPVVAIPVFANSRYGSAFIANLDDYITDSGINYWIFGHSHRNICRRIGQTECVCNQLGYVRRDEHHTFSHKKCFDI